jgi:hypothetical protein
MSAFTYSLVAPLSLGTQVIGAQLSSVLAGLGGIKIIDLRAAIYQSERTGNQLRITICYQAMPGGITYAAQAIIAPGKYDIDSQSAIWFTNNPTIIATNVLDATPPDESADYKAIIIVYTTGTLDPIQTVQLVRNTSGGSVAALASASMTVLNSAGLTAKIVTVVNNSGVAWGINVDGYATVESISGSWVGTIL